MNLSARQIELLEYFIKIEHFTDHDAAEGITKQLISEKSTNNLSDKQIKVFEDKIEPLFYPACEGVMGWEDHDTCNGTGEVDEESLLISYEEDSMLCQFCRFDREKMKE
ncbi:hypothetical protein ACQUW5_02905 [Legionella sp. CNM-1927-20]|uniref:hypothetical protein n=1 Tax=Legionella sp. CNM-1927-20 TaxID=3422221 RepID=UPI00403ADB5C